MPEIKLTPLEASITLVNEVYSEKPYRWPNSPLAHGHFSEEIARALHGTQWRKWFHPENNPLTPSQFLDDAQKGQLLIKTVDQVVASLYYPRRRNIMRQRVGIEDGSIHSLEEIAQQQGIKPHRVSEILRISIMQLRHPSRSRYFRQFLPEKPGGN